MSERSCETKVVGSIHEYFIVQFYGKYGLMKIGDNDLIFERGLLLSRTRYSINADGHSVLIDFEIGDALTLVNLL